MLKRKRALENEDSGEKIETKTQPLQNICYLLISGTSQNRNGSMCHYIGSTKNFARRLRQHRGEIKGGAKYTRRGGRDFFPVVIVEGFKSFSTAQRFEYLWKKCRTSNLSLSEGKFKEVASKYSTFPPSTLGIDTFDLTSSHKSSSPQRIEILDEMHNIWKGKAIGIDKAIYGLFICLRSKPFAEILEEEQETSSSLQITWCISAYWNKIEEQLFWENCFRTLGPALRSHSILEAKTSEDIVSVYRPKKKNKDFEITRKNENK